MASRREVTIYLLLLTNLTVMVFAVDHYSRADFPTDFVFGSGASAYQVEGAAFEDGRTPSIWDTFAHTGRFNGGNGDKACDQYHKYKKDVQLMASLGLEAYRFSISWSRLIPSGRGPVNPKGLQYYNNFIDELISHGIQPHATLYHNDMPQALEDEYGGLLNRSVVRDFTAYADVCFKEFGDRILHWSTFNEANVVATAGYGIGIIPPGRCSVSTYAADCVPVNSFNEPYVVVHNILLAHASVAALYNEKYKAVQHGFLGLNIFIYWFIPHTNETEDVIATQRANAFYVDWLLEPLFFGDYPEIVKKNAGKKIPSFTQDESNLVKNSLDFIGVNHYTTLYIKDNPNSLEVDSRDINHDQEIQIIGIRDHSKPLDQFPVIPEGLYGVLDYLKQNYGNPPIYIHENGQMMRRNGTLNDTARVEYLHAYIGSLLDALRNGSNTRGYFIWCFLDGFELLNGYSSGFGLYHVDLDDVELKRYPKLSAHWYTNFLSGGSLPLSEMK